MKVGTDGVLLGAWANMDGASHVLDIGTGTGLIALMAAQRAVNARVTGIEIDPDAAAQAAENVAESPFADRISIYATPIQEWAALTTERYDLIVSNPPFFSGGVLSDRQDRTLVRHTVKLPHQDLLRSVQQLLVLGGRFCVILPLLEGLRFQEMAARYNLHTHQVCEVQPRPNLAANRLLLSFAKQAPDIVHRTQLSIRASEDADDRSDDYRALTADFYVR